MQSRGFFVEEEVETNCFASFPPLGEISTALTAGLALSISISHIFQSNRDAKNVQFITTHNAGNFVECKASEATCCGH